MRRILARVQSVTGYHYEGRWPSRCLLHTLPPPGDWDRRRGGLARALTSIDNDLVVQYICVRADGLQERLLLVPLVLVLLLRTQNK